jgi:hypothetical protein
MSASLPHAVEVTTLASFAWKLYRACKEASNNNKEFENISPEVVSLHVALKETEDGLFETLGLSHTRNDKLAGLTQGIKDALQDLAKVLDDYEKLPAQTQRNWVSILARK